MGNKVQKFKGKNHLAKTLKDKYMQTFKNMLGNEEKALKFLSCVKTATQKNPALLKCEADSVINSFLTMAQLELMPSSVSGEAYVIPYEGKAQFQLGYQGVVTLLYRAGCKAIQSEIVYENDNFTKHQDGTIEHSSNPFDDDRGEPIGAYVIITLPSGEKVSQAMKKDEIIEIGKKFSKSFNSDYSPWNSEKNDPQLWMWKKTVLKQAAKLVPKNETINKAINKDNQNTTIAERRRHEERKQESLSSAEDMSMGNLLKGEGGEGEDEEEPKFGYGVKDKPLHTASDVIRYGKRDQLEQRAKAYGIKNPEEYDKKTELRAAVIDHLEEIKRKGNKESNNDQDNQQDEGASESDESEGEQEG